MPSRQRQRGQGTVEFVIIIVLFLALMAGLFEMTRVFRTKHTLNEATFAAARAGALNNARVKPMTAELANRMTRQFMHGESAAALAEATLEARAYTQALQGLGGGIRIVSPTEAIFDQLKKRQWLKLDGDTTFGWHWVIPNDNLRWRPNRTATVEGGAAAINLRDANLLKIRSLWCHRLAVPGLDKIIYAIIGTLTPSSRQAVCEAISESSQALGVAPGWYIAISSDATVRMQSPVVAEAFGLGGSAAGSSGGGGGGGGGGAGSTTGSGGGFPSVGGSGGSNNGPIGFPGGDSGSLPGFPDGLSGGLTEFDPRTNWAGGYENSSESGSCTKLGASNYGNELPPEGGIKRLIKGLVTVNQVIALRNVVRQATVDELRQLFPHLKNVPDRQIDLVNQTKIMRDLSRIGIDALQEVLQGGVEEARKQLLSAMVGQVAKALDVSKTAVRIVDIALSEGVKSPATYTCRKEVYDQLRIKYGS